MPRDAKLGFVFGVTMVILIAVIFYHRDGLAGTAGNVGPNSRSLDRSKLTTPVPGLPSKPPGERPKVAKQ